MGSLIGGRIYGGWYEESYDSFDKEVTPPQFPLRNKFHCRDQNLKPGVKLPAAARKPAGTASMCGLCGICICKSTMSEMI